MDCKEMKQKIDTELCTIVFTDRMKKTVLGNSKKRMSHSMLRYAAIIALTFFDWRNYCVCRLLFFE